MSSSTLSSSDRSFHVHAVVVLVLFIPCVVVSGRPYLLRFGRRYRCCCCCSRSQCPNSQAVAVAAATVVAPPMPKLPHAKRVQICAINLFRLTEHSNVCVCVSVRILYMLLYGTAPSAKSDAAGQEFLHQQCACAPFCKRRHRRRPSFRCANVYTLMQVCVRDQPMGDSTTDGHK